jgi:PleD family two-component response regulator
VQITVSGGLVPVQQGLTMKVHFAAADVLLYSAKATGRNRIMAQGETAPMEGGSA